MVKRVLNSNANAWKLYTFEMSNDCNKEWKQTAPRHTASVCWTITATKLAIGKLFYIVKITWFLVKLKVWQISWLVFSVYTQKMSNANARPTNWEAKIKQSNATKLPAKRKGSLFLSPRAWVLCLAVRLQFYCMVSHRICMRDGLVLEIVVSSAISAIAFLFRLFVHRSFFPLVWNGLNYADCIKDNAIWRLLMHNRASFSVDVHKICSPILSYSYLEPRLFFPQLSSHSDSRLCLFLIMFVFNK